jgi:S-adenosylmethionine decarboxylase
MVNAWAAWITMTLEVSLVAATLVYKLYLDYFNHVKEQKFRGFHVFFDYNGFDSVDPQVMSDWLMNTSILALKRYNVRCVHNHAEVFPIGNTTSPAGFTLVCLLDESHLSAHCYSDLGMLAVDVFTCGGKPDVTNALSEDIHKDIMAYLSGNITFVKNNANRFPFIE